jgi:hypothetical protein
VTDRRETVSRPIEAPLGVVVVGVADHRPVTIRVLDRDKHELGTHIVE